MLHSVRVYFGIKVNFFACHFIIVGKTEFHLLIFVNLLQPNVAKVGNIVGKTDAECHASILHARVSLQWATACAVH